jgi:hypothetical protein
MSSFTPWNTSSLLQRQAREEGEEPHGQYLQQDQEVGFVTPSQQDRTSQFGQLPNNLSWGGSQFTPVNQTPTPDFRDLRVQNSAEEPGEQGELGEWQPRALQIPPADVSLALQLQDLSLGPANPNLDPGLEEAFAGLQVQAPRHFPFLDLPLNVQQLTFQHFLGTTEEFLPLARLTDGTLAVSSTKLRWPTSPIFLVSQDFYFKAVTVFYSETTFSFEDFQALEVFLWLPDHLLRYVKHVRFSWVFFAQPAYAEDDWVNEQCNLFNEAGVLLSRKASLDLHVTAPSSYAGPADSLDALAEAVTRMDLDYTLHGDWNSLHPFLSTLMANISSFSYGYGGKWENLKVSLGDLTEFNHWLVIRTANDEEPLGTDGAFWLEDVAAMLLRKECPPWSDDLFWE